MLHGGRYKACVQHCKLACTLWATFFQRMDKLNPFSISSLRLVTRLRFSPSSKTLMPLPLLLTPTLHLQPGEYQLWISCKTSHANGTVRALPPNSKFVPWHHHELIAESPIPITVKPNSKVAARGCQPCTGPDIGTLGGQWVLKGVLADQCGWEAVGAVAEWHDDEHVWVPRQCTLPFFSREEFGRRFAGADLLLMGDSTVSVRKGPLADYSYTKSEVGTRRKAAPTAIPSKETSAQQPDSFFQRCA